MIPVSCDFDEAIDHLLRAGGRDRILVVGPVCHYFDGGWQFWIVTADANLKLTAAKILLLSNDHHVRVAFRANGILRLINRGLTVHVMTGELEMLRFLEMVWPDEWITAARESIEGERIQLQ